MQWTDRQREGFALAATIAEDRGAGLAMLGLGGGARTLTTLAQALAELSPADRRARLRALMEARD
jgi:hypothetical protein